MDIVLDATAHGLARPRGRVRDRGADPAGGRGRDERRRAAAGGRERAQAARGRARLQRDGRAAGAWRARARIVDQVAVWEQLGRVTNALCWCFSEAAALDVRGLHAGPARALVLPLMTGQAQGVLRDHRGRLGIGRRHRDDGAARCAGGYRDQRREVVRDQRQPRRLLLPAGAARGRPARRLGRAVLHRPGHAGHRDGALAARSATPSRSHHPVYRFHDVFVPERNRVGRRGRRHGLHAQLVPPRAADDRRALLRRGRAADRGGDRLRRHAHGRRRAAGREADDPGHARRQRDRAVGRAAHDLRGRARRTIAATT